MPALPSVNKTLQVVEKYLVGAAPAITKWYLNYTGTDPTLTELATLGVGAVAAWAGNLQAMTPPAVEHTGVEITNLTSPTAGQVTEPDSTSGSRTGGDISADACAIVQHRVGRRYRGGHCRSYLPAGTETDLASPDTWTSAFQTALANAWDGYVDSVIAVGWSGSGTLEQCNVSYFQGFHVVTNPTTGRALNVPLVRAVPVIDLIVSDTVNPKLGSQRRRNQQS